MILREAYKSMTKTKFFTFAIIFQLVVTSVVCNLVIENISAMNEDWNTFDQTYTQKNYYWIVENIFDNDLEKIFWKSENSQQRIINYYKEMAESNEYEYLELSQHDILIKGEDNLVDEYFPASNASVNIECLNEFQIKALDGRLFTKDEMNIDLSTQTLPILLGYNLRDKYKVGDVFEGAYFLRKMNYKVIGVLDKDSHIIKTNVMEDGNKEFYFLYLDNRYVTPLVNCEETPTDKDDKFFERILYQMKLNAIIAMSPGYSAGEIKDKIDNLSAKYDMYDFEVIWISNDKLNLLKLVSKGSIDIMAILAIMLVAFSIISIWAILSIKINKNIGDNAIHLLAGASRKKIAMYLIMEIILVLVISHILSFTITKMLFSSRIAYSSVWIGISVAFCVCACIFPVCRILQDNIDILLQGDSYE
jgi:hypothetical protein